MDDVRRKSIHDAMVRLSGGDRSVFDTLIDELWPVILSFAQRGVGDLADAEDIAQEVFYRICSRISEFDSKRDGLSWAFGIANYEIMTLRKRRQRRREVNDERSMVDFPAAGGSQEDGLVERELIVAFEEAVGELSKEEKHALGLTPDSERGGAMNPAFRKRKQRAFDRLRGIWRDIYGDA